MAVSVVWLKRDLRLLDHRPLVEAAARGPVVVLYVYEPGLWTRPEYDACHLTFVNQSLAELDAGLRELGTRVTYRTGRILDVLEALRSDLVPFGGMAALHSHQETGIGWTFGRDRAVAEWCRTHRIPWVEVDQDGVTRGLRDRDGWASRWERTMREPVLRAPERVAGVEGWDYGQPKAPRDLGMPASTATDVQAGGTEAGMVMLRSFLRERAVGYPRAMSSPVTAWDGCSRLSPHLAWGTVSTRVVLQKTERRLASVRRKGDADWVQSLETFGSRLRWRGHFIQRLESAPSIEGRNLQMATEGLRDTVPDPARFAAWCEGRTGYPMVDAVMRSLQATKWTSFRMRAMLVSFAAYDLWLHWRAPAVFLARHFLDFEPGIHFSQFQMQSGVTGINALRIYDPTKQARDHDPDGMFVRRWVPELRAVPLPFLHEPWTLPESEQRALGCVIGVHYPAPIVDHRRAAALAERRIEAVRRAPEARQQAKGVLRRVGSRRRR